MNTNAPSGDEFELPEVIDNLVAAHKAVVEHYAKTGLSFTLDGKFIGDIGEAIAAELFGIELCETNGSGIDGHAPDGRSVQVKATITGRSPVFRPVEKRADHLLFFSFNLEKRTEKVLYNGPEDLVLREMPEGWRDQRAVSKRALHRAIKDAPDGSGLPRIDR
ncbi:DUF6998 domain-containing protein [Rhizobium mongolense]